LGVAGGFGLAVLIASIVLIALLERRGAGGEARELVEYAREKGTDVIPFIVAAGRANRLLFLGDVAGLTEPKRIAADAIEALGRGPGLDAVVLAVPSDFQPRVDAYLNSDPEDAALLLAQPATMRGWTGASRQYLEIYRRVWRLNGELGPDRQIRVIAADLPEWPPRDAVGPREAVELYARRDEHMAEVVEVEVFAFNPRARVLFFMDGLNVLRGVAGALQTGGSAPVQVEWLAARMAARDPGSVYTILIDGAAHAPESGPVASYASTRAAEVLRGQVETARGALAMPVGSPFAFLRNPLLVATGPGVQLSFEPAGYRLPDVVDGYILLGGARRL